MYEHGGDSYRYPGFTDFSANINLLGAPQRAVERAREALDGITRYPQVGCGRLRQAIAGLEQVKPQEIICGNGAAEVIFSLALALKPRKALVFAPTFQEYEQALKSVDCQVIREYLKPEQGFRITEHSLAPIDDTVDMVFVCNPNNPTGVLTEQNMLERLLERCRPAGAVLVVDECFLDFVLPEQETTGGSSRLFPGEDGAGCQADSMKPFLNKSEHLFVVKAFTKTFGMPGLRLGYGLCGNSGILEKMRAVTQPWNVSVPAQEAGIAAAGEQAFLAETRKAVAREKAFLLEQLSAYAPELLQIYGHEANFIFFRSRKGLDQALEAHGIRIRNCSNFPGLEEGWYRIAVRSREENRILTEALRKILVP